MKKIKKIIFIILFIEVNIYGQSLSIGLGSDLHFVQGKNYFTNNLNNAGLYFINGAESEFKGLNFNKDFDVSVNLKYGFNNTPFDIITQIHYIPFRGNQSVNIYNSLLNQDILDKVTTKIDIWSFEIGGRYSLNMWKVKPYFTTSVLLNYFGDTWLQFEHDNDISEWRNYQNGMRYGLSFGIGLEYKIMNNINFEIGTNYNYMNIWNRRGANPIDKIHPSTEEKMNTLSIALSFYYVIL